MDVVERYSKGSLIQTKMLFQMTSSVCVNWVFVTVNMLDHLSTLIVNKGKFSQWVLN